MKKKILQYLNKIDFGKLVLSKLNLKDVDLKKLNFKKFDFKKIKVKKLPIDLKSKRVRFLGFMTLCCLLVGLIFGQILNLFLDTDQTVPVSANIDVDADTVYVIYLGTHETFEEVLAVEGPIRKLGYGIGINLEDGNYVIFSHVAGDRSQLKSVEETLAQNNIEHAVEQVEIPNEELTWTYFFKAVHQMPYEMEPDFIEEFNQDEMFIWGYYVALANDSLDKLSFERQQILRELYQWLNSRE